MSKTINELVQEAHQTAKEKGWHDEDRTFGEFIALIHSELSEALEDYRLKLEYKDVWYKYGQPIGIPIELADTVIRIFDACGKYGIDLESAIQRKMEYNKGRSHRHGGKKI